MQRGQSFTGGKKDYRIEGQLAPGEVSALSICDEGIGAPAVTAFAVAASF